MTLLGPISDSGVGCNCFQLAITKSPPKMPRLGVERFKRIDPIAAVADDEAMGAH